MASYGGAISGALNLAGAATAIPEQMQERTAASEDLLSSVTGDLGKVGTFAGAQAPPSAQPPATSGPSPSASPGGLLSEGGYNFADLASKKQYDSLIKKGYSSKEAAQQIPGNKVMDANSIFTRQAGGEMGGKIGIGAGGVSTLEVDQNKAKSAIENSTQFNIVSQMTSEANQMLNRSGPLYDEMMQSTQLPIIESSAALARENTENIRSAMARGGSARRDAFEAVQTIRAQDNANMQKGQALAQAHLQMDQWSRQYAQSTVAFGQSWAQNQAGIRQSFLSSMDNAAALMENSALPFAFGAEQQVQQWREAQSAQSRGTVNRWIGGVLGLAEGVMTAYRGGDASGSNAQFMNISGGQGGGTQVGSNTGQGAGSLLQGLSNIFSGGGQGTSTGSASFQTDSGQTITDTATTTFGS